MSGWEWIVVMLMAMEEFVVVAVDAGGAVGKAAVRTEELTMIDADVEKATGYSKDEVGRPRSADCAVVNVEYTEASTRSDSMMPKGLWRCVQFLASQMLYSKSHVIRMRHKSRHLLQRKMSQASRAVPQES